MSGWRNLGWYELLDNEVVMDKVGADVLSIAAKEQDDLSMISHIVKQVIADGASGANLSLAAGENFSSYQAVQEFYKTLNEEDPLRIILDSYFKFNT